jgi:hypothetical protein
MESHGDNIFSGIVVWDSFLLTRCIIRREEVAVQDRGDIRPRDRIHRLSIAGDRLVHVVRTHHRDESTGRDHRQDVMVTHRSDTTHPNADRMRGDLRRESNR